MTQKPFELHHQLSADTYFICDLPLCRAVLMNESQFPWVILIPRIIGATEQYKLSQSERTQLDKESTLVSASLMNIFEADKMNIAALGNMVPQLHIHHVARNKSDNAWPNPVWGNFTPEPYSETDATSLIERLKQHLLAN